MEIYDEIASPNTNQHWTKNVFDSVMQTIRSSNNKVRLWQKCVKSGIIIKINNSIDHDYRFHLWYISDISETVSITFKPIITVRVGEKQLAPLHDNTNLTISNRKYHYILLQPDLVYIDHIAFFYHGSPIYYNYVSLTGISFDTTDMHRLQWIKYTKMPSNITEIDTNIQSFVIYWFADLSQL